MGSGIDMTELVPVIVWPIVLLIAMFLFRRPIGEAIGRLANLRLEAGRVKIETVLQGQLSAPALREVMANKETFLKPQTLEVTVLICLIRGRTRLPEKDDISKISLVRAYQTVFSEIVRTTGGTIESTEPDRMLAFWGAPVPSHTHADDACAAALKLLHVGEKMSEYLSVSVGKFLPFNARIQVVLTTETVLAAPFGPENFPRYSILGDYGYQLKGLQTIAHDLNEQVLITEYTRSHLQRHRTRLVAKDIAVPGKSEPFKVYALEKS